jgi:hypothetical protein
VRVEGFKLFDKYFWADNKPEANVPVEDDVVIEAEVEAEVQVAGKVVVTGTIVLSLLAMVSSRGGKQKERSQAGVPSGCGSSLQ